MFRYPPYHRVLLLALFCSPGLHAAEPFIEHVAPPVLQVGKTSKVTFVGHDLSDTLDLWHSLPQGCLKAKAIESNPERAILEIETAAKAPVGIIGIRLATRHGLSNLHLLFIDDLPVKAREKADPMPLSLPVAVWGNLREAEIDRFAIDVKTGQTLNLEVVSSRFGKDADPLVTIRNALGKWIAERDNDPGLYFDSRFTHQFQEPGRYIIEVRDSRYHGSEHYSYVLRLGQFPAGRVGLPTAFPSGRHRVQLPELSRPAFDLVIPQDQPPGVFSASLRGASDDGSAWLPLLTTENQVTPHSLLDPQSTKAQQLAIAPATTLAFNLSPWRANLFATVGALLPYGTAQPTPTKVPATLCGVLAKPGERHWFTFNLEKGQTIHLRAETQVLNSPVDLELVVVDRFGREQRRAGGESGSETPFAFTANSAGLYGLAIRNLLHDGGPAYTYSVTLQEKPFPAQLLAEVEGLTIPQGSYQPIPLIVTRLGGSSGPIRLQLRGTPPGLKLTPTLIGENESSVICKLEADAGLATGVYTVQILAESANGTVLVRSQPLVDKQLVNVDLIPHALREDQRRLPPSVTDRFAVQVTPHSPFTMELPEPSIALPRYQHADIPIQTTRLLGFGGPIRFTATGGQLADKNEGRTRVYAEFPEATAQQANIMGSVHSKILSNLGKARIEVTGTATDKGRRVSLTRAFELNLIPAFTIATTPAEVKLLPGEKATVRLSTNRVKSFDGAVTLKLSPIPGIVFPETVIIPKGRNDIEVEFLADKDAMPRQQNLQILALASVDGFEEEQRNGNLRIEIRKVEPPKKK